LGTVFAITPSGGILDTLSLSAAVGGFPLGGVIQTADGTLYGTAEADGTAPPGDKAYGTIYTIKGLPAKR
jgi:hypothetical protein